MGIKFKMDFDKIQKGIKKEENKGTPNKKRDERFYDIPWNSDKSKFDATIRFLPPKDEDSPSRVKYQYHFFKGKSGKVFSERCLRDLGESCPVCEYTWGMYKELNNTELWKERCGNMTNNVKYVSNILVIDDKNHPENNGKVFLYKHPKTVADMVLRKIQGEKEDDGSWLRKPVNVLDWYDGCNFKLKGGVNKGGYPDYSDCYFLDPSEVYDGDDDKIEEVFNQIFDLNEFTSNDSYKDYGVLKAKLNRVLGVDESEGEEDQDVETITKKSNVDKFTKKKETNEDEDVEKQKKELEDNFKAVTGNKEEVSDNDSDVNLNIVDDDDEDDFLKKLESFDD